MMAALRHDPTVQAIARIIVIVAVWALTAGIAIGMAWERAERAPTWSARR